MAAENLKYDLELSIGRAEKTFNDFMSRAEGRLNQLETKTGKAVAKGVSGSAKDAERAEKRRLSNIAHNEREALKISSQIEQEKERYRASVVKRTEQMYANTYKRIAEHDKKHAKDVTAPKQWRKEDEADMKKRADRYRRGIDEIDARIRQPIRNGMLESIREEDDLRRRQAKAKRDNAKEEERQRKEDLRYLNNASRKADQMRAKEERDKTRAANIEERSRSRISSLDQVSESRKEQIKGRGARFADEAVLHRELLAAQAKFENAKLAIMKDAAQKGPAITKAALDKELAQFNNTVSGLNATHAKNENAKSARAAKFSKFSMFAFQGQQIIEDASYAGWRGISNNLAFMGAMLGGGTGLAIVAGVAAKGLWDLGKSMMGVGDAAEEMKTKASNALKALTAFSEQRQRLAKESASFRPAGSMKEWGSKMFDVDMDIDAASQRDDFALQRRDLTSLVRLREQYGKTSWRDAFSGGATEADVKFSEDWRKTRGKLSDPALLPPEAHGNFSNNAGVLDELIAKLEEEVHLGQIKKDQDLESLQNLKEKLKLTIGISRMQDRLGNVHDEFADHDGPDFDSSSINQFYSKFSREQSQGMKEDFDSISEGLKHGLDPAIAEEFMQTIFRSMGLLREEEEKRLKALDGVYQLNERLLRNIKEQIRTEEQLVQKAKDRQKSIEDAKFAHSVSSGAQALDYEKSITDKRVDKQIKERQKKLKEGQQQEFKDRNRAEEDFMDQQQKMLEHATQGMPEGQKKMVQENFEQWQKQRGRAFEDFMDQRSKALEQENENIQKAGEKAADDRNIGLMDDRKGQLRGMAAQSHEQAQAFGEKGDIEKAEKYMERYRDLLKEVQDISYDQAGMGEDWAQQDKFKAEAQGVDQALQNSFNEESNWVGKDEEKHQKALTALQMMNGLAEAFKNMMDSTQWVKDTDLAKAQAMQTMLEKMLQTVQAINAVSVLGGGAPLGMEGGAGLGGAVGGAGAFGAGFGGFFASGGDVNAGVPYIVGERGQELFIPQSSGTIFSHADTQRIMANRFNGPSVSNSNRSFSQRNNTVIHTQSFDMEKFTRVLAKKSKSALNRLGGNA